MPKVLAYTDGGARGNPGPAGAGAVAYIDAERIAEISSYLGERTNNYAEYEAIILILTELHALGYADAEIELRADSKLAVEQLSGNWKVKNANVREQFMRVQDILKQFSNVSFVHVPREDNQEADALANAAMDNAL